MRALSILFLLSTCGCLGDDREPIDDAAVPVDAPKPPQSGCLMGSLPTSRTITLIPGDPIPSAVINELQDQFVGDKRAIFRRQFFPTCWKSTGTAPTLVANPGSYGTPVWLIPTGQTVTTRIPYEIGERLLGTSPNGMDIELFGDGTIDIASIQVNFYPALTSTAGVILAVDDSENNIAAAWAVHKYVGNSDPDLAANGQMLLSIQVSTGTQLYVGNISPRYSRP